MVTIVYKSIYDRLYDSLTRERLTLLFNCDTWRQVLAGIECAEVASEIERLIEALNSASVISARAAGAALRAANDI